MMNGLKSYSGTKKKSHLTLWIILGVVFLGVGFLVFRGVRQLTGNPIILNQDDVPRLTVEEAYTAVMAGEAVLVDTRSVEQFEASHAKGAINLPVDQVEGLMATLDPEQWYITYCT